MAAKKSGVSAGSVQTRQLSFLSNSISQLERMGLIKPDAKEITSGIVVLRACQTQINDVIRPKTISQEPSASDRPSFNSRPGG